MFCSLTMESRVALRVRELISLRQLTARILKSLKEFMAFGAKSKISYGKLSICNHARRIHAGPIAGGDSWNASFPIGKHWFGSKSHTKPLVWQANTLFCETVHEFLCFGKSVGATTFHSSICFACYKKLCTERQMVWIISWFWIPASAPHCICALDVML